MANILTANILEGAIRMAKKVRSGMKSILVSALLGLLVASFAIWGIGGGMFVTSNRIIATVGDTDIETADLMRIVQNNAQQLQQQYGGAISTQDLIVALQLHTRALQQMLTVGAIDDSAASLGLQGSNEQVLQEMLKQDAFQPIKKGVIDRETVMSILDSNGLTYSKYEKQVKKDIAREQLISAITAASPTPRSLAEKLFTFRNETRSASLLSLPAKVVREIPQPQNEELESFYETRKSGYMAPEYRSYNYVLLTPESFRDKVTIDEEALRTEFDYKKSEYSTPSTRTLQQVSLENEKAANDFITRIKNGEDFVKVAVELSDFTEDEITLPASNYEQLEADFSKEIADPVFLLKEGEVSTAYEGAGGWSVFKVIAITNGREKTFDDVRPELEQSYIAEQSVNLMYEFTEKIEELLSEGATLTEISKKLDVPMATLTAINNQGYDIDGKKIITTDAGNYILQQSFQEEKDGLLTLKDIKITPDDHRMYLLEVTDITEPRQKTFEEVQSELLTVWQTEKRQEEVGRIAEAALKRIKSGEDFDTLAVELDGTAYGANNIPRTATADSNISSTLRALIFSLKKGDADMEVAADGNGYIIARLNSIKLGDPKANAGQVDVLLAQLKASMGDELMSQYQIGLGKEIKIDVKEDLFRTLFSAPQQ